MTTETSRSAAQYRLREESEERYRTVIEQSREALRSGDVLGSIVHPEDPDWFRPVVGSLGVTTSPFLKHHRTVQEKVFERRFE